MWFQNTINKVTNKLLVREIASKTGEVVFRRWRLLRTRWFQVFVHAIYAADKDYFLHDHPWNFASVVLKGGYNEDYYDTRRRHAHHLGLVQAIRFRKPGSFSKMRAAGEYHRIRKLRNGTCWTLVVAGPSTRKWGYITPRGWIDHETYRVLKNDGGLPGFLGGVWF